MVKVDYGLGRLEEKILADARTSGFIMYPRDPTTTIVKQETDQMKVQLRHSSSKI